MTLTADRKRHIDSLPYEALLAHWRFDPAGETWFEGETGAYWGERMKELRNQLGGEDRHVAASKSIGLGDGT